MNMTIEEFRERVTRLRALAEQAGTQAEVQKINARIADLARRFRIQYGIGMPPTPMSQALEIDESFRARPHLDYLSDRIAEAVRDVENGNNRQLTVSMPPRMGKSTMITYQTPLWLLRRHPEWSIAMASHDGALTTEWARSIRRTIETNTGLGVSLAPDGGAGGLWRTREGGGMFATSVQGAFTGRGAKVLLIDDPVKDFVEAHSAASRARLWNWWLSVAQTRLEPPYLVIVVATRWHEDDLIGRLHSEDYEGDPSDWEKISLPAIAVDDDDVLGRSPGQPLLSPLLSETEMDAVERWETLRRSVGTYTFAAMHQQRPAPQQGAIFDTGWWRYWTTDPAKATADGRIVYLDPSAQQHGRWIDSWDLNFESDDGRKGGWVVGQRWVRVEGNRYLVAQRRGRWTFTQTMAEIIEWAVRDNPQISPCGHLVHRRLVEKKANGAAMINTLRDRISGFIPITPTASKENRARAITPECESGNVYLPHPSDPGNEWMTDFLTEMRDFPHGVADDQVDALSQALTDLRDPGEVHVSVPGRLGGRAAALTAERNVAASARTGFRGTRGAQARIPRR